MAQHHGWRGVPLGNLYLWEFVTNFTDPFTFLPNDCAMKSLLND